MEDSLSQDPVLVREGKLLREYQETFRVLSEARQDGLDYAVVGGVAIAAQAHAPFHPLRDNGSVRDIDVFVLGGPEEVVGRVRSHFREKYEADPLGVPRVSIKVARPESYRSPVQLVSMIKKRSDGYALVFRDIEVPVPRTLFTPVDGKLETSLGICTFRTLPPLTLLHLYIVPIGSLRHKDTRKLKAFARTLQQSRHAGDESPYRPFHRFAAQVQKRYPFYAKLVQGFDAADAALFDRTNMHLLPNQLFRYLIDL